MIVPMAQLLEARIDEADAEAERWDQVTPEVRGWPADRLDRGRVELHELIERLERLESEAQAGPESTDAMLMSRLAIALRKARIMDVLLMHVLHERGAR
jgi:hypothetical protein